MRVEKIKMRSLIFIKIFNLIYVIMKSFEKKYIYFFFYKL